MNRNFFVLLITFVCSLFLFLSCTEEREREKEGEEVTPLNDSIVEKVRRVNVYIENSGSMDGYMKGKNDEGGFKDALFELLVDVKGDYAQQKDSLKVSFINTSIETITLPQEDITSFADEIDVYWKASTKKRGASTKLNDIFKNILEQTDSTTISILFSDCIYSLSKEGASNELSRLKHGTRNHFKVNLKKTSLSTLILQKESEFNGRYFPYTGDRNWYKVESRRPYYICIVGGSKLMDEFVKNMKLEDFDNRTNSFFLKGNGTPEVYYTILSNSKNCKYGEYKISGKNKEFVHSLRKVEVEKDKEDGVRKFQFEVAVDFSQIPVDEEYLLDTSNYVFSEDEFKILSIKEYDEHKINKKDLSKIKNAAKTPTHVILIESTLVHDVSLALRKNIPMWVDDSHTNDDSNSLELGGKTFGLKYWIEGIFDAYKEHYNDYDHVKLNFEFSK